MERGSYLLDDGEVLDTGFDNADDMERHGSFARCHAMTPGMSDEMEIAADENPLECDSDESEQRRRRRRNRRRQS